MIDSHGHAVLQIPAGFQIAGRVEAAAITARAFVTDTLSTKISLRSVSYDRTNASGCGNFSFDDTNALVFNLIASCTDSATSTTMRHGLPFLFSSIVPNPTSGEIEVIVERASASGLMYEVVNELGRTEQRGELHSDHVLLTHLPNGTYFLRLSQAGTTQTRKLIISR